MNIVFIYDDQEDYNVKNRMEYADFCLSDEAELIVTLLERLGHLVKVIKGKDAIKKEIHVIEKYDIVFNKMEGYKSRNREGLLPAIMEFYGIPYVGTDAYGFSLSLNKYHTKLIARDNNILTPQFFVIENENELKNKLNNIKFPIIIKPNNEGSSMGCQVFYEMKKEVNDAIKRLLYMYDQPVIVEEYIDGIDISVPIIGTGEKAKSIGIVEFCNMDGSYPVIASTKFKYVDKYITRILQREKNVIDNINSDALKMYRSLGCKDYGRIDFRLRNNNPYFLEINPLPTLCKNGAFDICAKNMGLGMMDIIDRIIKSAVK